MTGLRRIAAIAFCAALLVASAAPAEAPPPIGSGELVTLSVAPAEVSLVGVDDVQQLLVTGHFANEGVADVSHSATYRVGDPQVARIDAGGLVVALANGTTDVVVEYNGKSSTARVTVRGMNEPQPINFANEIVPVLTKLGCNAGACHGKADGQNGFKLSLLGFDPEADYEALVHEGRGRRVLESAPQHSLLLLKPSGQLGHGGGKPLSVDSAEYKLLERWVAAGLSFGGENDPHVVGIDVRPPHRLLAAKSRQQITVAARYSDGTSRDVTRRAE